MIATVSFEGTQYASLPLKFEAGTPNFIGQTALGAAITYISSLDQMAVTTHMYQMAKQGMAMLHEIEGLKMYGVGEEDKIPLFSFSVLGAHATDMATLLDKMGYAVRSGQMCAEPLLARFGQTSILRASFAIYNTEEELVDFVKALKRVILMLR